MHEEKYHEYPGSNKIVIFIHGFAGSPLQFDDLADIVYERGFSYMLLILPGHGGKTREFVKSTADDWLAHVQSKIEKIREKYDKIYLTGHSMGGLLALKASVNPENKISGVFMISTPLKINLFKPKALFSRMKIIAYSKNHQIKKVYIKTSSVKYSSPLILKPCYEFYKLVSETKKILKNISVPVCMIHSENDETTSVKSAKLLTGGIPHATAYTIKKSLHMYFYPEDRRFICDKLIGFIT